MNRLPRHFFLVSCLVFLIASCKAQNPKPSDYNISSKKALKLYLQGNQQEKYRAYQEAINFYEQAIEIEPNFGDAWFRRGACNYVLRNYGPAEEQMEKASELLPFPNPLLYFYLAECKFYREDFEGAAGQYDLFFEKKGNKAIPAPMLKDAERHRKSAQFAVSQGGKTITFNPVNLGENINTAFDEYLPYLTADEQTIFFTTRRPGCTGGFNREYRGYTEDFYYAELKDGEWVLAENFGPPVNTEGNEGAASFTPDGQFVFFTACSRRGGYGDCDIYVSRLDGKTWSKPRNLGPLINTPAWESQPCISNDGRTLYFASSRKGGQGGQDIWKANYVNGSWSEPVNLGPEINSPGNEVSPFLHADGKTLYFSSSGHLGYGGLDLFMSKKTPEGWTPPENLGNPLNTSADEGNIFVNAKGTLGYINSTRESGLGRSDIYSFELDPKIRPDFTTYVRGYVKEEGTGKPLASKVTFINLQTGDTIRSVYSNKVTGKFLLTLPLEQDYAAFVDKKGYLYASQFFSLKDLDQPREGERRDQYFDVDIELQPLKPGIAIVMSNVFYETNKYALLDESKAELEHLVQFMKLNPNVKVEIGGHTDNVGSTSDNAVLSENRAGSVKEYLASRGIAKERVKAKGYGESTPIDDNETEEGRAMNRRTECRIVEVN